MTTLLRRIARLAWPVLIGQWASMMFGVLDTAMTGHASAVDLAAMGLSVTIYITVFVGLMGVLHALIPILAQLFGAGRWREMGAMWGQGIWLALALSLVGGVVLMFPGLWLALSGDLEPAVRGKIEAYLLAVALALPAALMFRTLYALANAVSRPMFIMLINIGAIAVKFVGNALLIYGLAGLPALGALGAGISTIITSWAMLAAGLWWLRRDRYFRRFRLRITRPRWSHQAELLRLGLPMGGSYLVEVCAFSFMALIVAREGTQVIGGQQIVANLTALAFMMPMALGVAAAALTAQAIGAGDARAARRTGRAAMLLGIAGALTTALILYAARAPLAHAYTSDAAVAATAMAILPIIPLFHLCDAMQCLVSYLLRAYKVALVPLVLQALALGGVGLTGGWWLGFGPGRELWPQLHTTWLPALLSPDAPGNLPTGAATMWMMSGLGLALSATLLWVWYGRVVRRTLRRHS